MRKIVLAAFALAFAAGGCSKPSVYGPEKKTAVIATYAKYCESGTHLNGMVSCGAGTTYLVYERSTGEKVVGRLLGLDPDTGALQVAWSYHDDGTLESEEFYPGSSKVLPGRIAEIATVKNPDEWARLDKLFAVQAHTSMQA